MKKSCKKIKSKVKLIRKTFWFCSTLFFIITSCKSQSAIEFVVLPDTQSYMEENPEIFLNQIDWIVKNKARWSFVLHEGDITQNNNQAEWEIAAKGFRKLDGQVPYSFCLGNHDMGSVPGKFADIRNTEMANANISPDKLKIHSGLISSYPDGSVDNLCHEFKAGGYKWLVLSLEFGPREKTIAWAGKIIENHPNHRVIIVTHAYLYEDNTLLDGEDWWQPQAYGVGKDTGEEQVNNGVQLWEKLISKHKNIRMVFSGHILKSGTGKLVSVGDHGNTVYQMLANYQKGVEGSQNGGNGYLRIIKIDIPTNSISVSTYSPWIDEYLEDEDHHFVFNNVLF